MNTVYRKEYTFTGYTITTREFVLKSYGKQLPPELATNDLEKISKALGFDFTSVETALIRFRDGHSIDFLHEPMYGDDSKTIQGQEFVRDWYTRRWEQYVHPEHHHITYRDGKISVHLPTVYPDYGVLYQIEIPEKFPIDDWEVFARDPHKEVFPHVPLSAVKQTLVTKNGALILKIDSETKEFDTSIRKTKKYFAYRNVPFIEGMYDVKVPKDMELDITKIMSVHDLPDGVKTSPRFEIIDRTAWKPKSIAYFKNYSHLKITADQFELSYYTDTNELSVYPKIDGFKTLFFDNGDGLLILNTIPGRKEPLEYILTLHEIL